MIRLLATVLALLAVGLDRADDTQLTKTQEAELPQYFGFGPMQIYKIKPGISQLELADFDADGHTDIILWNAYQSRIELFYQPDPAAPPADDEQLERNEIPSRGNMRRENVPVAYRVATLKVAELTGDQRPDIVFFGEPKEVVVLPGKPDGGFGPPQSRRAPDGEPRGGALCVGDFNHDGRTDVALLGGEVLQIFHQKPSGGLAKPVRLVHGVQQPGLMVPADLNADGRDDLVIATADDQYGMCVYLQDTDGTLSALHRIKVSRTRSLTVAPAPGGDKLLAIQAASGRLNQYRWKTLAETHDTSDWPQRLYSYPVKIKGKHMPLAIGDVTGDGLADCVAADPDAAQLVLFSGTPDGLSAGRAFPGLVKTVDLQIADLDGDGHNELLSVSAEEKTVGVSCYVDERLTFPRPFATSGQPLAAVVGRLQPNAEHNCLAYVTRDKTGDSENGQDDEDNDEEKPEVLLRLVDPSSGSEIRSWKIDDLDDDPSGLRCADVDQNGRMDLLLFSRYSAPQTFVQQDDGSFAALKGRDTRSELLRGAKLTGFCLVDVTGDEKPEILLAQEGLARALFVQDGRWTVVDQYNPDTANAEITGLAALPDSPGSPTLAMYDRKARDLLVLRRRADQAYAVVHSMPVGNFDLAAMRTLPIGKDRRPALLMAAADKLALLTPGERAPTLIEEHSYESDAKGAWLGDSVGGDLNHDGIRDIAAVDMRKASIEILTTLPAGGFVRALRFQVFQGKRFSEQPDQHGEPREVLIGELTGDGINDIALLVHDRLIVYPGQ